MHLAQVSAQLESSRAPACIRTAPFTFVRFYPHCRRVNNPPKGGFSGADMLKKGTLNGRANCRKRLPG
jgi:hypothetical protein